MQMRSSFNRGQVGKASGNAVAASVVHFRRESEDSSKQRAERVRLACDRNEMKVVCIALGSIW